MHRKKGALGRFLKLVEAGEVPEGSVLVVDRATRLSREGVKKTLEEIVFKLLKRGITLQFLDPRLTFDRVSLEGPLMHVLVALLQSACQESKDKSDYSRANWKQKRVLAREERRILTAMTPAWLRVGGEERLEPIPEAVEAVRTIFKLKAQGVGMGTIEARLNRESIWKPPRKRKDQKGNGWRVSYIKKILSNRAVLGEYQPYVREEDTKTGKLVRVPSGEAILDYFPRIVPPDLFHAVQERLQENQGKGGRLSVCRNLLAHLAKCAYCGGPMAFSDRGKKGGRWLICDRGRRCECDAKTGKPVCARHAMKYDECEKLLLDHCLELRPEEVLPRPDEQVKLAQSLRQRLQGQEAEVRDIEQQVENLIDQIGHTTNQAIRDRYEVRVRQLDERKATTELERIEGQRQLRAAEQGLQSFTAWKRNLEALRKVLQDGDVEVRQRMRAHLQELIDKIEVFATGTTKKSGPSLKGYPERFHAFLRFVEEQRTTKAGRFLRVHFKTGTTLDLAPLDSFGLGIQLAQGFDGEWDFCFPRHRQWFKAFLAGDGSGKRRKRKKG